MNTKNRLFSIFEVFIECVKFHSIFVAIVVLYHYIRVKFLPQTVGDRYHAFGFRFVYANKDYLPDIFFEHFGFNSYFFKTESNEPVIIDIGANIGDTALYFKWLYPNAHIYAFEPHPTAYKLLQKNIKLNNLKNVHIFNEAIGNTTGSIDLFSETISLSNTASIKQSYIQSKKNKKLKKFQVKVNKLDSYEEINNLKTIDLLKIDVEGAEGEIFKSLDKVLPKVKKIILEFHFVTDIMENSFDFIIATLNKHGLKVSIQGFYRNDSNITHQYLFFIIADK